MNTKQRKAGTNRCGRKKNGQRLIRRRENFVRELISIVLSGGIPPYMAKDSVARTIQTGKEALLSPERRAEWVVDSLDELVLALDIARYTFEHIEEIMTEEDELKAVRPHIMKWLEEQGHELPEEIADQILKQLAGYWDKFDRRAWEAALRYACPEECCVAEESSGAAQGSGGASKSPVNKRQESST